MAIIIPIYNKWGYTEACLRSLAKESQRSGFEVIVVDDGSTDESAERLTRIAGITAHRNAENLGFVGSCNAGAALARGEYLVFLNNDTQVAPNWLDTLLDTFDQHPRVGLVGSKLVYPDGRLQEAGGIVFSDGSGWNYGRFGDPRDPACNFVREVDYCSGAAIAIPRAQIDLQRLPRGDRPRTASPDVVVVDDIDPPDQIDRELPLFANVELRLGDEVSLSVFAGRAAAGRSPSSLWRDTC